ncbi:Protein of unknown function [Methylobacterium sp. UNC378MF]|uniref:DUF2829 domain-containing protein n=1 Tax=Methylobacterium oryzae TaxID=334852 RepID=A0ABU7TMR8_9HYPH|nr:MW1434 family type I TA system toxin [Methylobacterium sp. UNC378MF]SDA17517.1 Protein of unknown function [Methylobacterium sp. UNC378MF]
MLKKERKHEEMDESIRKYDARRAQRWEAVAEDVRNGSWARRKGWDDGRYVFIDHRAHENGKKFGDQFDLYYVDPAISEVSSTGCGKRWKTMQIDIMAEDWEIIAKED